MLPYILGLLTFIVLNDPASNAPDWTELESVSNSEKLALIESVKTEFDYLATYETWKDENLSKFHFIDLDKDGDLDLIFDGWSGGEPTCVRIYLNRNDEYHQVLDEYQIIQDLQMDDHGLSSISIEDPGCCSAYIVFNMEYTVFTSKDTMDFVLDSRTARIENTLLPSKKLGKPVRFSVENDFYFLRATPSIDTTDLWYEGRRGTDNIIAKYSKGAEGTAYGHSTDETGRVWWFVEIDPKYKPIDSHFYDFEERPTKLTGWMSSRFLKEKEE